MRTRTYPSGGPAPSYARVGWVDDARGIGILLVVVGHTLPGLRAAGILGDSGLLRFVEEWIYSFHMPLFFFLAGLFATSSARAPLPSFVVSKLRTVAYPYLVWSVLQTAVQASIGSLANTSVGLWSLVAITYQPVRQFWFLYTLFVIFVVFGILRTLGARPRAVLAFALALYVLPNLVGLGSWGVPYSVANHMIYFAVGVAVAGPIHGWLGSLARGAACTAGAAAFAVVTIVVLAGAQHATWSLPLVALTGTAATAVLASATNGVSGLRFLNRWGRLSLQIYVAHTIAAAGFRIVLQRVLGVDAALPHVVGGVAVGILAPLALDGLCEHVGFRWAFTWPTPAKPPREAAGAVSGRAAGTVATSHG